VSEPAPVRIDDLADPRFPAAHGELLASMAAMAPDMPLEPGPLLGAAVAAAGLDDFGDDRFREPLDVLTRAFRTEGGVSPAGTVALHTQLVQLLVNRLRLVDLLRRHPEILDVPVRAPIVIAGLPRTGTTHLHNLLAADPALRSLPYWEAGEPIPDPSESAGEGEPDPRMARTEAALSVLNDALPHFRRMHEMTVDHAHEEIQLLALDLSTMFFETLALVPTYRDWYRSTDQTSAYRTLRTCLQALTWLRGGRRWVLKSPQHLEQFGPLMSAFPDAVVVVTHRDPVEVTASMTTMLAYLARLHVDRPDPHAYGAYWSARLEDMLAACTRDRDLLPADRSVDVRFDDLMADELGTVERIYELADQPFDGPARDALGGYLASHRRGRHGRVLYDLADLGLDPAERAAALSAYRDRFGV
jgi:hypothetical protein